MELSLSCKKYIQAHYDQAIELLITLAQIPAPSHHEDQRVSFCQEWLLAQGAPEVMIDQAKNLIVPIHCTTGCDLTVCMAHSDIVFPDTTPLPLIQRDGRLYCPGIGDDTWNVVCMLMATKYILELGAPVANGGMLVVINACEEGLGNLLGSRTIMETYGSRIKEFISFDSWNGKISNICVGSRRYRITLRTAGGHSFECFGAPSAIAHMAALIQSFYAVELPKEGRTTYNVGIVSGGTSVNTIAQEASMLYEFRSDCATSLAYMERKLEETLSHYRNKGYNIQVEAIGERPCMGAVDMAKQADLTRRAAEIVAKHYQITPTLHAASTDCNIPLSMGIPAIALGCFNGGGAHTREEYIELDSLLPGLHVAFEMLLQYFA